MTDGYTLERPVTLTCPECGGAMRRDDAGTLLRYRCHIGHRFSAESMSAAQFAELERALTAALRRLNERAELCREMEETEAEGGTGPLGRLWRSAREQAFHRAEQIREMLESEWMEPSLVQEPDLAERDSSNKP